MSAAQHERVADAHEDDASSHVAKYDPKAAETRVIDRGASASPDGLWPDDLDGDGWVEESYNPTTKHLQHADEHAEHARQHRAAAKKLRDFENQACEGLAPRVKAQCPLEGVVEHIEDVPDGVRLQIDISAPLDAVYAHVLCHYAFAQTAGRTGMDRCPLYVANLQVARSSQSLILTTDEKLNVRELRQRAHDHLMQH